MWQCRDWTQVIWSKCYTTNPHSEQLVLCNSLTLKPRLVLDFLLVVPSLPLFCLTMPTTLYLNSTMYLEKYILIFTHEARKLEMKIFLLNASDFLYLTWVVFVELPWRQGPGYSWIKVMSFIYLPASVFSLFMDTAQHWIGILRVLSHALLKIIEISVSPRAFQGVTYK